VLIATPSDAQRPRPLVLWFHGLQASKDVHRPEIERLAAEGFLAVAVDVVGHGDRHPADAAQRVEAAGSRAELIDAMLEITASTVAELPGLVDELGLRAGADATCVSLVGISMGAYLVYQAVVGQPGIRAAVAILGSPRHPGSDSPHSHPEAFRRVALLSITAELDESVSPEAARAFHRELAEAQPPVHPHRYVELAGAHHLMSAEHWATTMEETVAWLRCHGRNALADNRV
jgi:uncharacterized protein